MPRGGKREGAGRKAKAKPAHGPATIAPIDGHDRATLAPDLALTPAERIDALGLVALCERIGADGESLTAIARSLKVAVSTLTYWIGADETRARAVAEARQASAETYAARAEQVLLGAETPPEIQRARELASHYRWMASKRAPALYGDRLHLDAQHSGAITETKVTRIELVALAPLLTEQPG